MNTRYKFFITGTVLLFILGGVWLISAEQVPVAPATNTMTETQHELATSSLATIPVSGVVEAADTAVIAAATNGVVTAIAVGEGSVVLANALLVQQATPVADAQVQYRGAEAGLTTAQQQAAVDAQAYTARQAAAVAYSAETIAALQSEASLSRTKEQTTALRTGVESGVTTLLSALTFAQDNRELFADERREQFTTIVSDLYGRLPNQFHTGVLYGSSQGGDVLDQIETLRGIAVEDLSVVEVQTLAVVVQGQLRATVELYTTAEATVLDPDEVTTGDAVYEAYFTQRSNAIAALGTLESASAALQTTIDATVQQTATNAQSVVVSELDKAMAERQAKFASEIEAATQAVATAARAVAVAEQSLGVVRAPFAGVVAEVLVDPGEYAAAGTPLLRLVGDGAREVTLTVPATVIDYVTVGAELLVDGVVVGQVVRRSPVSNGSSYVIVVSLADAMYQTGASLQGELTLVDGDDLYVLPRAYVYARAAETYVTTVSGDRYPVRVVSDNGASLVVTLTTAVPISELVPARSISVQ